MNRLKEVRKEQNLSLADVAFAAGIGRTTLHDIEKERYIPRLDVARKLSKVLCASMEYLWPVDKFEIKKSIIVRRTEHGQ